jgi:cell division protein FtsW
MKRSNNFFSNWLNCIDQKLVFSVILLCSISILLVTTSSPSIANRIGITSSYFVGKQTIYLFMAGIIIFFVSLIEIEKIKYFGFIGMALCILLLICVKIYGYEIKGAKRWISFFGFSLQPSELIKPFLWIVFGRLLEKHKLMVSILIYLIAALLIIIQPDFGTFFLISLVFGVQLFVAGLPMIFTLIIGSFISVAALLSYFTFDHVKTRIDNFLDPTKGENYQINKSIEAFQNGGIYGRGIEEGTIKNTLPDSHTDFIFAVAAEEFGIILCLVISSLFCFIVLRSLLVAIRSSDRFKTITICGIASQIGFQSLINMGVTLNLLPTKGMTLPMISYGGSSLFSVAIGVGILLALTKFSYHTVYVNIKKNA